MRLSLSSTLKRRAFSSKTHRFEKRPWEWIKTKTHTNRISVDGRKSNKAKWKYHKRVCYSMRIVVLSFSNVLLWVVENVSKGYFERESIDAFSMTKKTHTLKTHLLVQTEPLSWDFWESFGNNVEPVLITNHNSVTLVTRYMNSVICCSITYLYRTFHFLLYFLDRCIYRHCILPENHSPCLSYIRVKEL